MRIAHLTTADVSLALLLRTELDVDIESGASVLGISAPGRFVRELELAGVRHRAVPSLKREFDLVSDVRAVFQIYDVLREERPDVLHTHTPKAGVIGRIVGRAARVPVVVNTCHGLWATRDDPLVKRLLVYGAEGIAAQFSDYELFQNADDQQALAWCLRSGRSQVVGNGVNLDLFRFTPNGRKRIRDELGLGEADLLVGGVGRQVAEKGVLEFASVAERLSEQARFIWVGPADRDKPDAVVGPSPSVDFLGMRTDMPDVYSALDVFVLPSHREGFSRSAMEAAACGRAMVLSDIRGCREVAEAEREALFVRPGQPTELGLVIERLLDDADLRVALGTAAADRAHREFDQRDVAAASLAVYREVLRRKAREPSGRRGRGAATPDPTQ